MCPLVACINATTALSRHFYLARAITNERCQARRCQGALCAEGDSVSGDFIDLKFGRLFVRRDTTVAAAALVCSGVWQRRADKQQTKHPSKNVTNTKTKTKIHSDSSKYSNINISNTSDCRRSPGEDATWARCC